MAVLSRYDYIFAIATVFTFLDAWNIGQYTVVLFGDVGKCNLRCHLGANDVANSFATSVSSRSLTLKQAMVVASFCELAGSITVGERVADTIRTKIIDPHHFDSSPPVLLLAMACAIISSSTFLTIATRYGMPVSTTHSIMGGLVGSATASIGIDKINWGWTGVSQVFAAWAIAPGIAGVIGAIMFFGTRKLVLTSRSAVKRAFYSIPVFTFLTVAAITSMNCPLATPLCFPLDVC